MKKRPSAESQLSEWETLVKQVFTTSFNVSTGISNFQHHHSVTTVSFIHVKKSWRSSYLERTPWKCKSSLSCCNGYNEKKWKKESFRNNVSRVRGRRVPKISDKKWHRGEGVHANGDITTKKKLCASFSFSLDFGQGSSSWALLTIPVGVPFQILAWVFACRLN